ncbi:MAG TPA: c-type cytochrome biogenesis protein CcmI [Caulobacteraceae bacterium]|nr:c-type cytochrome biogenesis protein CcmI [Caulobacteraceae bacterium]
MIAFWVAAALLAAAAALIIVSRAARAAGPPQAEDPALAVYRRQLDELDDLADRGLLPESERRSARTEAARRLLAAADASPPKPVGKPSRAAVLIAAGATPLLALGVYVAVGSPGLPDQPFAARLKAWTATASDQATAGDLGPEELAAVWSEVIAQRRSDPVPLLSRAHAEAQAGDLPAAEQDLRRAIALDPNRAPFWQLLGDVLTAEAGDDSSPEAHAAFERAVALDPTFAAPRYALGREAIAGGDVDGGLKIWRELAASLPATDSDRQALEAEIGQVAKTRALPANPNTPAGGQAAMIQAMVAQLAARLKAQPNDPEGWGRLIRSYSVLGDQADRDAAVAAAQQTFKNRPDAWRQVVAAEGQPQ